VGETQFDICAISADTKHLSENTYSIVHMLQAMSRIDFTDAVVFER